MDAGQLFGLIGGVYFLLLGGFAAITAAQALEEGDGAGLGMRVFRSLTKTTLFLGVPTLIAVIALLAHESRGGGGGIMSRDLGLFVLFFAGLLGLLVLWTGSITMGFVGAAVARNLSPWGGALAIFLFVGGAPVLMSAVTSFHAHQRELRRHHR